MRWIATEGPKSSFEDRSVVARSPGVVSGGPMRAWIDTHTSWMCLDGQCGGNWLRDGRAFGRNSGSGTNSFEHSGSYVPILSVAEVCIVL